MSCGVLNVGNIIMKLQTEVLWNHTTLKNKHVRQMYIYTLKTLMHFSTTQIYKQNVSPRLITNIELLNKQPNWIWNTKHYHNTEKTLASLETGQFNQPRGKKYWKSEI